jgi:hypothetical protein
MVERQLPEQFQELELFLNWSLATKRQRTAKRHVISVALRLRCDPYQENEGGLQLKG